MSGSIDTLCTWAAALTPEALPPDVVRIARLQHLALAGAARRLAPLPSRAGCGEGPQGELAAALLYQFDDSLLGGRVGAATAPLVWNAPRGSLGDLLAATVAANEVAARAGLAGTLSRGPGEIDLRPLRVGAAVVRARLQNAGAAELTAAVHAAMGGGPVPLSAVATPAAAAQTAGQIYGSGEAAPSSGPELPVWEGAGEVWFTRTLAVSRFPGSPGATVALDGLDVILGRHLKAGEKRLRAEQVERIDVRVGLAAIANPAATAGLAPPALGAWSVAEALALLLVHHELGPEWLEPGASGDKAEEVVSLATRVDVTHDWKLSVRRARQIAEALGPVLGPVGIARLLRAASPHLHGLPAAEQLVAIVQERPWAAAMALRTRGGLAACKLDAARVFPTEIKLYTTRGGWWPERRNTLTGLGADLEAAARARFGNDPAADRLLAAPLDHPALDWVAELRG